MPVAHSSYACHKWCECSDNRYKSGQKYSLTAVLVIKGLGFVYMFFFYRKFRIAYNSLTEEMSDPIIYRVAQKSGEP